MTAAVMEGTFRKEVELSLPCYGQRTSDMLPSEDAEEREGILVRVTCGKLDSCLKKKGSKGSLTAIAVVSS